MTGDSRYTVDATETSLTVLEALVAATEPLGVTALAERVGVSKSIAYNHLSTLRALGYVVKRGTAYEPSLRTLTLGNRTRNRLPIYGVARTKVDNLAETSGETAVLFVLEANRGVPAYVVDASDDGSSPYREGERYPLHVTAPGKAILASLSSDRVDDILSVTELPAPTEQAIADPDELRAHLGQVTTDGVAFSREEHDDGVVGVAAPISDGARTRPAAVGVCGPAERLSGRRLEEDVTGQVLSSAKSIQVDLASE